MVIAILMGTLLGFLAGLGIGGGSLLMLWLTFGLGYAHETARGINLLFFLPSAVIAILFRWKQGHIHWGKVLPGILAGCLAAYLFSYLGASIRLDLLKKLFGGLLILTGLREFFGKA